MTNDLAVQTDNRISPWGAHASSNLAANIAGDLVTFAKGVWRRGESKAKPDPDARFICNMNEIYCGWVRWEGGKATEHRINRLIDMQPQIARQHLGDTDKDEWEQDRDGKPRDPWVQTDKMVLKEAGTDSLITFTTSSVGGRQALAKLCQAYDRGRASHPGEWPIVKLEATTYDHANFGLVYTPVLRIVGWGSWDGTKRAIGQTSDDPRTMIADHAPPASADDYGAEIPF